MNEKFDIGKFIRGFNIFRGEILGKVLFYVVICLVVCGIFYVVFLRPTHKTTQTGTITNVTQLKEEAGFELVLIPPKVKVGSFKFKLFK